VRIVAFSAVARADSGSATRHEGCQSAEGSAVQKRTLLNAAIVVLVASAPSDAVRYRIDTWAGGGARAGALVGDGGPATFAVLNHPSGLVRDRRGNVYVADHDNARVRRIRRRGRLRLIETIAGTGVRGSTGDEGPARDAQFVLPTGLAMTPRGDLLVVDAGNDREGNTVRRIDARGIVHRFAGQSAAPPGDAGTWGPAIEASLRTPLRAVVARNGDVYVVELNNHRVRVVRAASGILEPFAGSGAVGDAGDEGPAVEARLDSPAGLAIDRHGVVYIADFGNHRIRMVTPDGIIHALAGTGVRTGSIDGEGGDRRDDRSDGVASGATFSKPTGIALERDGALLVADQGNHVIRRILPQGRKPLSPDGGVETIVGDGVEGFAGDGGDALAARLSIPTDVLPLGGGQLLVADRGNHRLRIVVPVRRTLCRPHCSDGNPCTIDRCDPEVGCTHAPSPSRAASRVCAPTS
jgi:DNA-binding beta-propeller fold protein YncE